MGYLLSPNTGEPLSVLETIRTVYDVPWKIACEIYTSQVLTTKKIDQTAPPKRNFTLVLVVLFFVIIAISLLVKQLKNFKR